MLPNDRLEERYGRVYMRYVVQESDSSPSETDVLEIGRTIRQQFKPDATQEMRYVVVLSLGVLEEQDSES